VTARTGGSEVVAVRPLGPSVVHSERSVSAGQLDPQRPSDSRP
jgi:hypothetical protein